MNKKIIEYDMLRAFTTEALARQVNESIEAGWQPFGNSMLFETTEDLALYQAVVKYADE